GPFVSGGAGTCKIEEFGGKSGRRWRSTFAFSATSSIAVGVASLAKSLLASLDERADSAIRRTKSLWKLRLAPSDGLASLLMASSESATRRVLESLQRPGEGERQRRA